MDSNEKNICKDCQLVFNDETSLHRHFRKHRITVADYYYKYHRRVDKLTGELIEFKSKEHYFANEFNTKSNLVQWFSVATDEEIKDYISAFLKLRKEKKNLKWCPTQVELRSLISPSILTIEKYMGGYTDFCKTLGFERRFYDMSFVNRRIGENCILIDTREQTPLSFGDIKVKVEGLKYGDYRLEKDIREQDVCVIERKSAKDFLATFTEGFDRFVRELERAKADKAYLVVLVEERLSNLLDFKNKCAGISPRTKITPEYVFRNVREILQKENKIQFLFVDGREEAARIAEKLLYNGFLHTSCDLQLLYDDKDL